MRTAPKYRHWILGMSLAATPLLAAVPATTPVSVAVADDLQDISQLEALAQSERAAQLPPLTDRQRFLVGPIQPHLKLERCNQPVGAVASAHHMRDRIMIELRCQNAKPWHLYVQVRVIGTSSAVVAAHAIVAGSVLTGARVRGGGGGGVVLLPPPTHWPARAPRPPAAGPAHRPRRTHATILPP